MVMVVSATFFMGCGNSESSVTTKEVSRPTAVPAPIYIDRPVYEGALEADYNALMSARNTLAGTASLNWSADKSIDSWDGVTVIGDRVTRVLLADKGLNGTIPPEFGRLDGLIDLSLSQNQLSGEIPRELRNLTKLEWLDLGGNQLSGEIPPELGNLSNLQWLLLGSNQLSGEIPPELGNLSNLTDLDLGDNQLSGEIPPELGNLSNLTAVFLGHTRLTGQIPWNRGKLHTLNTSETEITVGE